MKSNYMNYFKDRKCYQWDKDRNVFVITKTNIDGEFCLDQKGMDMFLKFNNPEATFDKVLTVKSGKTKATIKVVNEELVIPNMEFTNTYKINLDKLKIAKNFVSKSEKRPILTGINISKNQIVATDSFSAYRFETESECDITITPSFIDVLTKFSGEIEIKINSNTICFENEDTIYIGRLLNGAYPSLALAKLFVSTDANVILNKTELLKALSLSNDKKDCVNLSKNKLLIQGENNIEVDIDINLEMNIWFDLERFLNVIKNVEGEEIKIQYIEDLKPLIVNNEFLILPIKKGE